MGKKRKSQRLDWSWRGNPADPLDQTIDSQMSLDAIS